MVDVADEIPRGLHEPSPLDHGANGLRQRDQGPEIVAFRLQRITKDRYCFVQAVIVRQQ
ncbi:hypothetical protein Dvina_17345 [Dactylosporangium vinaceum]|uniref:Uncharacterized protein n=1 Tax=Dactylosporangium vinaceum TaxID=53362 RepID=A0ABV5M3J0_9ACTN|nr:hypothetical protein [Dactylosporangium vinaceum]UAB99675.1 hypothetical protein Dvina_17345 [Dactylosporangium vinaceum]